MDDGGGAATVFVFFAFSVILGLIPASIHRSKNNGSNDGFVLWWIYGTLLFIIALIHALLLQSPDQMRAAVVNKRGTSSAEELQRFAKLRDDGIISENEFLEKKRQILQLG